MRFRCDTVPLSDGQPGHYLVQVNVCGLCRSDLSSAVSWAREWEEAGHEFGGTIVVGPGAAAPFGVGQRVAVRNASVCRSCPPCLAGRPRDCQRLVVNKQGYREFAWCDERSLVDAEGLDDDRLALVEPTNVALELLDAARLSRGERVVVLGGGTVGLIASFAAMLRHEVAALVVVGRSPEPSVETLGAASYLAFDQATRDAVMRRLGGPVDVVLVTTPPATLPHALDLCRPGGRVLTLGLDRAEACTVALDVWSLIFRRISLTGVFAAPNLHFEAAVSWLRKDGASLGSIVRRRIVFDDLEACFRAWHERGHFDGKTILVNPRLPRETIRRPEWS
jgi:threonine dehydrogenase-like Zn-dependent dehydrogenase